MAKPDGGAARDLAQRSGSGREGAVARKEDELGRDAIGLERLHAHDEEEPREHAVRNQVDDDEERAGHGAEGEEALGEVGDALLDDMGGFEGVARGSVVVSYGFGDAEGFRVEGRLRDETVGHGEAEEAGDTGGEAQEEEIPVEAGGFAEGEFAALGDEGRY
ncbi:hypothetical protein G7046_g7464 [Stylonectria norvegica]|nr:hypothetical protein G7046_g7464 [Stylonectria norvegica]